MFFFFCEDGGDDSHKRIMVAGIRCQPWSRGYLADSFVLKQANTDFFARR